MYLCCLHAGERRCRDACLFEYQLFVAVCKKMCYLNGEMGKFATSRAHFRGFSSL